MKNIAILGSTGSIGQQALDVIEHHPEEFCVEILTANNNAELLIQQAFKYQPHLVVIANEEKYPLVKEALAETNIVVYAGAQAIAQVVQMGNVDIVITAMVGYSGLLPTINAIKAGKTIALANKETLVVAGDLITQLALDYQVSILPVDSEHSAIFQCLVGEYQNPIEKIILTCSGGPFHGKTADELWAVKPSDALKHPNWDMGAKITIDSASLMNKGFEVIEAKWLFDLKPEQIDVTIHPQSIIHSMVQFGDGSIKAQLGLPDMRLPIQFALSYPDRLSNDYPRLSFDQFNCLTFKAPDRTNFNNLNLAYEALRKGGSMACALNASNEIVVQAFLEEKISFPQIWLINETVMHTTHFISKPTLEDYIQIDTLAREMASREIQKVR